MKKLVTLILLALMLCVSGYSQEVTSTVVSSSQTVSGGGSTSVVTGNVPSNLTHAPGIVRNAKLVDWLAAHVRRRETFNAEGQPYAVFIARNGCAFGLRHEHEVMGAIQALMKPGEVLMTDPTGFYYIGFDTLVSPLTAGPDANPGVMNITHGAGVSMASSDQVVITPGTGTPVSGGVTSTVSSTSTTQSAPLTGGPSAGEPRGVHAVTMPHDVLGQVVLFYGEDKQRPLGGERFRHLVEPLTGGKQLKSITQGQARGAWYVDP